MWENNILLRTNQESWSHIKKMRFVSGPKFLDMFAPLDKFPQQISNSKRTSTETVWISRLLYHVEVKHLVHETMKGMHKL